jgi:putative AlgH/UPF0301 family transcriptional regulator
MQLRPGSLLIAHPIHCAAECRKHVVLVTESTHNSTMGITLNHLSNYDLRELMLDKGLDWAATRELWIGGDRRGSALVMLHSSEWYSSNTMPIDTNFSISSDAVMIDKVDMGNTPQWYKLFVGCKGWKLEQIVRELNGSKPKWLYLAYPSPKLIEADGKQMWNLAVTECSQDLFNEYF